MAPSTKLRTGARSDEVAEGGSASLDFVPLACAGTGLLCILFVTISLGTHEWVQGTVLQNGQPVEAFVGLGSVTMGGVKSSFSKLCPKGTKHAIPPHFTTTPAAVWCKCEAAGTVGAWLLWLAYLPLWAAVVFTAIEGLAGVAPQAKGFKAQLVGMGLSQRVQNLGLIGCWAFSWLCLFLGLLAYAGSAPDTLGWGTVNFEASFGLARLSFLIVTICTAVLTAKLLRLWQEEQFGEALGDFLESRGVRRGLYLLLFAQLVLFLLVSIANLEWQALIPLFALYYLDTDKANFLVLYVTLSAMTLLFDMMRLTGEPRWAYMDGKDAFAEAVYVVIFFIKLAVLGLLGALKREENKASQYPTAADAREPEIAE
ncbi:hypothetical protein T492DRAFT_950228 [Pavlovales sp. CCMP2436]|nr:hypothetical protein T492DRAFT_950228 [Pavlovales sp. CCMP2436]